jgi:hypothetical protein
MGFKKLDLAADVAQRGSRYTTSITLSARLQNPSSYVYLTGLLELMVKARHLA